MSANNRQIPQDRLSSILHVLRNSMMAIVGGGDFCLNLLEFFSHQDATPNKPTIIGVADINPDAKGLRFAQQLGIFTTSDYRELYTLEKLELIIEVTHNADLAPIIRRTKPEHIKVIDHFEARYLWDILQLESIKLSVKDTIDQQPNRPVAVEHLIELCFDQFNDVISHRNDRFREIELELMDNQRTQSQIIQGSTIPTFVINKDHIVTHWNRAMEKLSGYTAMEIVGTNHQWVPFWDRERPTMADVILDQIDKAEIQKLYGSQWRKSALIDGAYEAEILFPHFSEHGKWLWFTAAPIKSPDGTIIGAIETLWDKTEDRKAEEERSRHTKELAALCSIYTALSAPWQIDYRIEAALKEIHLFLESDSVAIYLHSTENKFHLAYRYGQLLKHKEAKYFDHKTDFINRIVMDGELITIEELDAQAYPAMADLAQGGIKSVACVPISAKGKKTIGILQVASRKARQYGAGERHVLDLIGNRIGVAIENATLQEQYRTSEEKYRSLFNNDPNPIFIIDQQSLTILDVNARAEECYGYSRTELQNRSFLQLGAPDETDVKAGLKNLDLGTSILFTRKRHFNKKGTSFYVNINASRAEYGNENVLIATTTDITETVEKETKLIQASKMTTLGLMAAGMAHEINQPLNVIQICADYFRKLQKKNQSISAEDLQHLADDITANVARATGIIRHVRDFARQSEVIKSRLNINRPIEDVFKVLGNQIKMHQIELDLDLAPDLPDILADHNRLEQVFINLVTNAIDAMDEKAQAGEESYIKRLRIQTECQTNRVVVVVTDNGVGMSEEVKNKLFEPFFTTKKVGKGTGLGVSISYGIIKDYDGAIEIDSRVGEGTTFTLTFPKGDHIEKQ
jgi:PAS domain S-box-containing protein